MAEPQARQTPPKAVEFAVVELLHATEEFTRAYEAWLHAPEESLDERRSSLDDAERRLEEAQHEVVRREAMARSVQRMVAQNRDRDG